LRTSLYKLHSLLVLSKAHMMKTRGMLNALLLTILGGACVCVCVSEAQPTAQCTNMDAHGRAWARAHGAALLQTRERGPTSINLTDMIHKIYYINLDKSTDRRASIEGTLSELSRMIGVPHERFAGVNGNLDAWCIQKAAGNEHVLGTLGCFRSHLSVWEKAFAEEPTTPWIMVMEDDASIPDARKFTYLRERLEYVPSDADIVLVGPEQKHLSVVAQGVVNNETTWVATTPGLGSFSGYLVKVSSINKIVPAIYGMLNVSAAEDNPCMIHVDCVSSRHPSVHKYALVPGLTSVDHDLAKVSSREAVDSS